MSYLQVKTQEEINALLQDVVERVYPVLNDSLDEVVLYGSYARGDADAESDVDIILLVDKPTEELPKIRQLVRKAMSGIDLAHETLVCVQIQSGKTFNQFLDDIPYYQNITRDGVVYYQR